MSFDELLGWLEPLPEVDGASDDECVVMRDVSQVFGAEGTLATLLTVFPLTAPLVLPARSALVGVPLWQHALAVALVLVAIYLLVRLAGRVYAHGLLHGGSRLTLRTAWRIAHQH
jgi:ABC-type Na+ efflux pump permease subunit